jgi:hypothetical protein
MAFGSDSFPTVFPPSLGIDRELIDDLVRNERAPMPCEIDMAATGEE